MFSNCWRTLDINQTFGVYIHSKYVATYISAETIVLPVIRSLLFVLVRNCDFAISYYFQTWLLTVIANIIRN